MRACRSAIEFNSIPCVEQLVPGGRNGLKLMVKVGTPRHVRPLRGSTAASTSAHHVALGACSPDMSGCCMTVLWCFTFARYDACTGSRPAPCRVEVCVELASRYHETCPGKRPTVCMLWRLVCACGAVTQSPNLQETVQQDAVKAVFPYGQVHLEVSRSEHCPF